MAIELNTPGIDLTSLRDSPALLESFRHHLDEVVHGAVFKGSMRSQQFLAYVIDRAIAGSPDSLKERVIGVELFQRSPTYDTGEDAIVRVTASDVRRRLLQHYGSHGVASAFRINLPTGSYVPEVIYEPPPAPLAAPVEHQSVELLPSPVEPPRQPAPAVVEIVQDSPQVKRFDWRRFAAAGTALLGIAVAVGALLYARHARREPQVPDVLPWSAMFRPGQTLLFVTSDPNISEIQELTHQSVTLSDYANQKYVSDDSAITPQIRDFIFMLRGDKAAAVDTPIAVAIAQLARSADTKVRVKTARSVRLSDLQTNDNLVLLGSPRSDPWFDLFSNELDFRFAYNKNLNNEVVINPHPRPGETTEYSPTARGWATGDSFAIIAFVQNQYGQALLIAGAAAEGTEAGGRFITDLPSLSSTLQNCGIKPDGQIRHFELLLHMNTIAGSPRNVDVVACHILTDVRH